jgi:hypothetical protein
MPAILASLILLDFRGRVNHFRAMHSRARARGTRRDLQFDLRGVLGPTGGNLQSVMGHYAVLSFRILQKEF